jgi:Ser/Thr protein kinase RdoA (MazF antagonist)
MGIENTTPGTNAVFLCGQFVVKIYAPKQTGIPESEYRSELEALRRAAMQGVPVPKIFASGYVEDKYGFYYMITERAQGREARKILPEYSYDEKFRFVQQLNGALNSMNTRAPFSGERLKGHALNNEKWDIFSLETKLQIREAIESIKFPDMVYVHGDLTGENIIINRDEMNILDFGDARPAPFYYEYPPIVFDLFGHDPEFTKILAQGKKDFADNLFRGTLLHEYGAHSVRDICIDKLDIPPEELDDISRIKDYIKKLAIA